MAAIRRAFDIAELQEEVAQLRAHVNNQADMEALEAEVRELRQNIVSPRSKGISDSFFGVAFEQPKRFFK